MIQILIIDDSPTEAEFVKGLLEHEGYEVIWADAADKGIKLAKDITPDVILMDVVMPNMSGFQATRKLTRNPQTATIPIIMLTSKAQSSDKAWAERNGAVDYLVKPPTKTQLINAIDVAVSR